MKINLHRTPPKNEVIIIKDEPESSFEPTPKMSKKKNVDKSGHPKKEKESPNDNQWVQR